MAGEEDKLLERYGKPPDEERGFLLPIMRQGDKLSPALPGIVHEPYEALKRLLSQYSPGTGDEQPVRDAANVAGAVMLPSLGLNAMGMMPKNAVGIFGGRLAHTADQAALAKAEEMAAAGADRQAIWNDTGWFQGRDGKWRFEIDDSQMKPVVKATDWIPKKEDGKPLMAPNLEVAYDKAAEQLAPQAPVRLKRLWDHPELDKAYRHGFANSQDHPGVMGMPVQLMEGKGATGQFVGPLPFGMIGLHQSLPPGAARSAGLHEIQHAVGAHEGFAQGASIVRAREHLQTLKDREHDRVINRISEVAKEHPDAFEHFKRYNGALAEGNLDAASKAEIALLQSEGGAQLSDLKWRADQLRNYGVTDAEAFDAYKRFAGEVESRNVEARMNMTADERRAKPPWETQDTPDVDQILSQYGNGQQMSMPRRLGPADYQRILERQRATEGMRAAMRDPETGKVYTGWTHQQAIDSIPPSDTTGAWGRLSGEWDRGTDNTGFINARGQFVSRGDAERQFGVSTMEDLRDLRKAKP